VKRAFRAHPAAWSGANSGVTLWDAKPGHAYRVGAIPFSLVHDAMRDMGIREGSRLEVTERNPGTVAVIIDNVRSERVRLEFGAFVPLIESAGFEGDATGRRG
jgi:Fe2+ transport system protein FeoA